MAAPRAAPQSACMAYCGNSSESDSLKIHASKAGDAGQLIHAAQIANAPGEVTGGNEAIELDEDRAVDDLLQPR